MNLDHIFLDISHVDRKITAIALVRTDRKGKKIIATFQDEVCELTPIVDVIAGIKKKILNTAFGNTYVVVSHFAETDKQLLRENGVSELFIGRAWIDPSQIAWPFVYHDLAGERSLEALCAFFNVTNPDPDTATGNCEALVRLYWAMMGRYKLALTGEEAVRELGGDVFQKVTSILGL